MSVRAVFEILGSIWGRGGGIVCMCLTRKGSSTVLWILSISSYILPHLSAVKVIESILSVCLCALSSGFAGLTRSAG